MLLSAATVDDEYSSFKADRGTNRANGASTGTPTRFFIGWRICEKLETEEGASRLDDVRVATKVVLSKILCMTLEEDCPEKELYMRSDLGNTSLVPTLMSFSLLAPSYVSALFAGLQATEERSWHSSAP